MVKMFYKNNRKAIEYTFSYFDSVTDAYHFYLRHFFDPKAWLWNLYCAHTLLSKVTDENIMCCLFRHCFTRDVWLETDTDLF